MKPAGATSTAATSDVRPGNMGVYVPPAATPAPAGSTWLERIAASRRQLELDEFEAIKLARARGESWARIGDALGKTRASAQQWYAARVSQSGR